MNRISKTNRNTHADFIKGILILGVMFEHSLSMVNSLRDVGWSESVINVFVTSYEMPLFILLSGYFLFGSLSRRPYGEVLWKRIWTVALPLLIWEGVPAVYKFLNDTFHSGFVIRKMLKIPYNCILPGRLWFLGTYLYCSIAVIIIEWICSKVSNHRNRTVTAVLLYSTLMIALHLIQYPIVNMPALLPFFLIGFYLAKHNVLQKIKSWCIYVLAALFVVLYIFYRPEYSFYVLPYIPKNDIGMALLIFGYRFVLGLCGCCLVYAIAGRICGADKENKLVAAVCKLGNRTMEMYILSVSMQVLLRDLLRIVLKNTSVITDWTAPLLIAPVFLAVMTGLCLLADNLIRKASKLHKVLFGR